jgi:hypothetical protein
MSAAIPITRLDRTASELRSFASKCGDGAQVRRILAIALVLDGHSRAEAAAQNGMDRQTLSDWVHRYNANRDRRPEVVSRPGRHPVAERGTKGGVEGAGCDRPGSGEGQDLALPGFTGGNRPSVLCPGA